MRFRLLSLAAFFVLPVIASAEQPSAPSAGSGTGQSAPAQLTNPLQATNLLCFLQDILDIVIIFAVPIIILMIIYAGFMYVMAQGRAEQVKKANYALLYAVIGGVIILGADLLITVITGTVGELGTPGVISSPSC